MRTFSVAERLLPFLAWAFLLTDFFAAARIEATFPGTARFTPAFFVTLFFVLAAFAWAFSILSSDLTSLFVRLVSSFKFFDIAFKLLLNCFIIFPFQLNVSLETMGTNNLNSSISMSSSNVCLCFMFVSQRIQSQLTLGFRSSCGSIKPSYTKSIAK